MGWIYHFYAIENCKEEIKDSMQIGNANLCLLQISISTSFSCINTLHNLHNYDLDKALREIERVGKNNKYICVEFDRNETEKANLLYWQVTCSLSIRPEEWEWCFKQTGYNGDHSPCYLF